MKELRVGQNLFEALKNVCDFIALESDMQAILSAVEKDNSDKKNERLDDVMPNDVMALELSEFAINNLDPSDLEELHTLLPCPVFKTGIFADDGKETLRVKGLGYNPMDYIHQDMLIIDKA